MSLREMLSDYWYAFQQELFPRLESELGPMGGRYELFVAVLELVRVEALLPYFRGQVGRPEEDRAALARAFIAKAVFDVPTTRGLIERLEVDGRLCRLCGWSGAGRLPSEATFSRAFSEFAESRLASRLHETLIARTMDGHLVEHISRDATAIEAREKPAPKPKAAKPKRRRKRGRPRKGEARAKEPSRLERQLTMSLPQMLADLPRACDVGTKRNAKGHTTSWIGYKLHVDTADGGIPISCIMTSASTHDSQVAIPLGTLTAGRVENLYDLMDAAYDSIEIWAYSILLGHKPIIDVNPRRSVEMQEALKQEKKARRTLGLFFPEERCQRRLKLRPKGGAKDCHLGWWSELGVRLGVGDAVRGFFGGSGQRSHAELKRSAPAARPQGGMVCRVGVSLATRASGARCRPGPGDGVPQFSYRHCFCGRGFG